jgi:succinate dehydrogenase / fumarate reductase flavoprotein subunit
MEKYAPSVKELASRDVVSRAIMQEVREGRGVGPNDDAVFMDLSHLDDEIILKKLPELRELAITFQGLDMLEEPILISATAHYSMGGIPVNKRCQVRKSPTELVEGFYAAGECSCVSVHGANRLGANSLLEALFFGREAGRSILADLETLTLEKATAADAQTMIDEHNWVKGNNGNERVPLLREELQNSMSRDAGVFRTEESLKRQIDKLGELYRRYKNIRIDDKSATFNTDLQEAVELGHMLEFSLFIVQGALERRESRGAHYRDDYTERDDTHFLKHTFATLKEGYKVEQEYADVVLGQFEPQARVY